VTFDDGTPAIGMHFQLFRKTEKGAFTGVGLALMDSWTIHALSDSRGRFSLTNLPAGEYTVCTLMPADEESAAPRVCLGDVFRRKNAKTVKVGAGETASGVDIEIPLSGLHTVSGAVTALADGHPINHGTVRLLYADDREKARETALVEDGTYSMEYVPKASTFCRSQARRMKNRRSWSRDRERRSRKPHKPFPCAATPTRNCLSQSSTTRRTSTSP